MNLDLGAVALTIGGALLGNALVLAVLGFVGRSLFKATIDRDLERFKITLKAEHDHALEAIKYEASQQIESYKVRLKKSEFLFERQFQAATAMMNLFNAFSPRRSNPMMDWSDAMEEVVAGAGKTELALRRFRDEHGVALIEADREALGEAIAKANDILMEDYNGEPDDIAAELHRMLEGLAHGLIDRIQSQSSL